MFRDVICLPHCLHADLRIGYADLKRRCGLAEETGMRIDFKFRHLQQSDELTSYVSERIIKLEKFELKPVRIEFTFSVEKSCKRVDIHVRGDHIEMHAHSEAETFFEGVDHALDKISRQLAKKKARVQDHHAPKASQLVSPDDADGEESQDPKVG